MLDEREGMFTERETERQDCVDDACYDLICAFCPNGLEDVEWNIEHIGKIRDALQEVLVDDMKVMTEMEFYPYRELEREPDNGNIILEPAEEMIITDEQLVNTLKQVLEDIDADELAVMAGDWLGGLCWYTNDGLYAFIPDERYCGGLDFTKELNKN